MRIIAEAPKYNSDTDLTRVSFFGKLKENSTIEIYDRGVIDAGPPFMTFNGSHNCCCTQQLMGFFGELEQVKTRLTKNLQDIYDYSVVLTDDQDKVYGKVLKEFGFEKIRRWHNRVHGPSILNLYLRGFQDINPLPLEK